MRAHYGTYLILWENIEGKGWRGKKPENPDLSEQRLQIHFVQRIDELMREEKLNSMT